MRALRFEQFGPPSVLGIRDIDEKEPGPAEVVVRVLSVGLNPVDYLVRQGRRQDLIPISLPSGIGSDFSGTVSAVGPEVVRFSVGDEVFGWTAFGSLAESVVVSEIAITHKNPAIEWDVAGSLAVSGITAYDAVESQHLSSSDTVLVSAAAGGVGVLVAQLALRKGAIVVGSASSANHERLARLGILPVHYGPGLVEEVRAVAPQGVTVAFDQWGEEAVRAAIDLGVPLDRINTIAVDPAPYGVVRVGRQGPNPHTLDELAHQVVKGELVVPLDSVHDFEHYLDAFERAEGRHVSGKVVIRVAAH